MPNKVISVEHLTKKYDLGVISSGTLTRDLERWWARVRKQPDPYSIIGHENQFSRNGQSILALDDVNFTVEQGETLGIIGSNGAGKSTLLKVLSRVTAPTSGVVKMKGRIGSLLEVGTGFHPELTGRENIFLNGAILGMRKEEVARKFDEIVDFSGVEKFIDTPVKRYSSGMYVRLAFAVAAHLDPEILIVDEVLAVGDADFQKKCLGKMGDVASEGRTVLFVSHNMASISKLCERSLVIFQGRIVVDSSTNSAIDYYFSTLQSIKKERISTITSPDGKNVPDNFRDTSIYKIELLDEFGNPKDSIRTWDTIKINLHIYSKLEIKNSAVEYQITDKFGLKLLRFSTQPDSNIPYTIKQGHSVISCIINNLPLSAGNYWIGCGLSRPNEKWLWFEENMLSLQINPRDILESGLAPISSRSIFVTPHEWII